MLPVLHIIAILVAVLIVNNGTSVNSTRFCVNSDSDISTCPGDHLVKISPPFWIENRNTDYKGKCTNYPGFQIKCAPNGRPVMNIANNLYYVLNIIEYILTVVNVDIHAQECPHPRRNISIGSARFLRTSWITYMTIFYNCSSHPQNVVQNIPCLNKNSNTSTRRSFAFFNEEISSHQYDWYKNCEEAVEVPVGYVDDNPKRNYTQAFTQGFEIGWTPTFDCEDCRTSGGECWANETNQAIITSPLHCNCTDGTTQVDSPCSDQNPYPYPYPYPYSNRYQHGISNQSKKIIGGSAGAIGVLLLLLLLVYRKYCYSLYNSTASKCRKIMKGPTNAEMFIWNNYEGLSLQNYKYSDIKKMTNSFEDTLGQGGYGRVFKGKLRDGRLVAVKVLNESKGKGEDFINEIATIGRTNHVNVVGLLGFSIDIHKQALVYEFMPNGSLEKFIHTQKDSSTTSSFLGWEKLYQIALGIARGLEYLHRGCNTRILHFDIKPHNILLDIDFCPKISDFGLAKVCPTRESLVSMVGARGTIGYIAPEVCCRNFGGVSHKSDVYSYGMMVLEMIGGRKNIDVTVENNSEIYFPQWIYKRLRGDVKVEGSEKSKVVVFEEGFEEEVTQKMIIVALWCIQAHPGDRPSMTHTVEMLEGNTEDLQLPPNPFPDPSAKPFPSLS